MKSRSMPILKKNGSMPYKRFSTKLRVMSIAACLAVFSCEDYLEIDPPKNQIVQVQAFANDNIATSTLLGIYSRMMSNAQGFASGGIRSVTYLAGLSADELYEVTAGEFFVNQILPSNSIMNGYLWNEPYQYIYTANAILEGLRNSTAVTEARKKQLEGEARFIRAFCYFYLVNLFGDVPLHITTDYRANRLAARSTVSDVYKQIISDLVEAQDLLDENYVTPDRVRPNKFAATALLARVYLYVGDWENAKISSTTIINNTAVYTLVDVNQVFLRNSKEAIWQLMPVVSGYNTFEGSSFVLVNAPLLATISEETLKSFESGDRRKVNWTGSYTQSSNTWYFPYKYKIRSSTTLTEYSMVFRLAEQYLIRAEAYARQGNIGDAVSNLNVIRQRAGLPNLILTTVEECLVGVEQERRVEFFAEWGHRWLDLKRFNKTDAVLAPLSFKAWQSTDVLYPIPQDEINRNVNILQNDGY